MKKLLFRTGLALLIISILAALAFTIWAISTPAPMPEAVDALKTSQNVRVATDKWLVFQPIDQSTETGLIIYPGGRVDPRSYAPTAAAIAEQGYLVVITPMPLNLAVFNPDQAMDVILAFPEIQNWVIAGHSLGGSMAANFVQDNFQMVDGLIFWASYPAESDDLSELTIPVLSIYGTLDGLTSLDDINMSRQLLPNNTSYIPIEGGNHAQFGWYGDQSGDNPAQIDRQQQQALIIKATTTFLEWITNKEESK